MAPEASISLPTGDKERVLQATIGGAVVSMEAVVSVPLAERVEYDADQMELYHGYALPGTATTAAGWMIYRVARDGNKNLTAKEYASNAFDKVWDDRAGYVYA